MLLPNKDGMMQCEEKDCDFETSNVFELFDHCGVEFEWSLKVSKNYSFNLYGCFEALAHAIDIADLDTAYEIIQNTSILLANAGAGELDKFIEEIEVKVGVEDALNGLERMLKDNG